MTPEELAQELAEAGLPPEAAEAYEAALIADSAYRDREEAMFREWEAELGAGQVLPAAD